MMELVGLPANDSRKLFMDESRVQVPSCRRASANVDVVSSDAVRCSASLLAEGAPSPVCRLHDTGFVQHRDASGQGIQGALNQPGAGIGMSLFENIGHGMTMAEVANVRNGSNADIAGQLVTTRR